MRDKGAGDLSHADEVRRMVRELPTASPVVLFVPFVEFYPGVSHFTQFGRTLQ
jgi:hypothetical protein